jgi:hypothetical protein
MKPLHADLYLVEIIALAMVPPRLDIDALA